MLSFKHIINAKPIQIFYIIFSHVSLKLLHRVFSSYIKSQFRLSTCPVNSYVRAGGLASGYELGGTA